jgi:hypothetical protein
VPVGCVVGTVVGPVVVVAVVGSVLGVLVSLGVDDAIWVIRVFAPVPPIMLAATRPVATMTSAVAPPLMRTTGWRRMGRKTRCLPK